MTNTNPPDRKYTEPMPDLNGKTILITGGTGSFGQAFVKAVLNKWDLSKLIVFSRDEAKQWEMCAKFDISEFDCIRYFIGDVRDLNRLELAMRKVDYVIHAAALKHVPTAEYNPFECIRTNVIGSENIVNAALRSGVQKVIALSSDKAANPANLYGASKLAADKIFVAANNLSGDLQTQFSVVRYGNVIGSRGSVVPLFRRLIERGEKSLPITDPRMTRFWITLDQGVNFVLSSLELMAGGEIFIPKIPSMRIVDLANEIGPNMPLHTTGIRPGEKLHEVLITENDGRTTVELSDRYVIKPALDFYKATKLEKLGAEPVQEDFIYSSDTNDEWIDSESLKKMLGS